MALKRVNKSKLGVDERRLNESSIEFLREDSPMISVINNRIVEGLNNNIQVVKDDSGNHRPFLVVEIPQLHAKVALYMTSSVSDIRMEIDNAIRGEHLFKSPFGLYNYISRSSVSGRLDQGKHSVIDRDRFFFLTEDTFIEQDSRAKNIEDFNIGLGLHTANAFKIEDLLKKDLADFYFIDAVKSGREELWVYKRGAHQPIIFNPSASYLKIAINAFERFKNEKNNLNRAGLKELSKVAIEGVKAYSDYLIYEDMLKTLERSDPKVYKVLSTVRYYQNLLNGNMISEIKYFKDELTAENRDLELEILEESGLSDSEKRKKADEISERYSYRYIYGDPLGEMSLSSRIKLELERAGIEKYRMLEAHEKITQLLRQGKKVSLELSGAVESVISVLDKVNPQEKIDLSEFKYSDRFWAGFYENYSNPEYIDQLSEDFKQKYLALSYKLGVDKLKSQERSRSRVKQERLEVLNALAHEREVEEQKKELFNRLMNKYFVLYGKSFAQFKSGKLVGLTESDLQDASQIYAPYRWTINKPGFVGAELAGGIASQISKLGQLKQRVQASIKLATDADETIKRLSSDPECEKTMELMEMVYNAQQRILNENKGLSQDARDEMLFNEIKSTIYDMDEETLSEFTSIGKEGVLESEELLASIHDLSLNRSFLKSYMMLRINRFRVLDALNEFNDEELIKKFNESKEAVEELKSGGLSINSKNPVPTIEQTNAQFSEYLSWFNGKKIPTLSEYNQLIDLIDGRRLAMERYIEDTRELLEVREIFNIKLEQYGAKKAEFINGMPERLEHIIDMVNDDFRDMITDPKQHGFEREERKEKRKIKAVYVSRDPSTGEIDAEFEEVNLPKIQARWETEFSECMDGANYLDRDFAISAIKELNDKLFPDAQELRRAVRAEVGACSSVSEAVKKYQAGIKHLNNLLSEQEAGYGELVTDELVNISTSLQTLLFYRIQFGMMFEDFYDWFKEFKIIRAEDGSERDIGLRTEIANDAYQRCLRALNAEQKQDLDRHKQSLVKIIDKIRPRTDLKSENLIQTLSTSKVKGDGFNGVLFKAVMGENGVDNTIRALIKGQHEKCSIISIGTCRTVIEGDPNAKQRQQYTDLINFIEKSVVDAFNARQDREIEEIKLKILESFRQYATGGDSNKLFITSPKEGGLKWFLEKAKTKGFDYFIKKASQTGTALYWPDQKDFETDFRIAVNYSMHTNERKNRVNSADLRQVFLANYDEICEAVESGSRFAPTALREVFDRIQKFHEQEIENGEFSKLAFDEKILRAESFDESD